MMNRLKRAKDESKKTNEEVTATEIMKTWIKVIRMELVRGWEKTLWRSSKNLLVDPVWVSGYMCNLRELHHPSWLSAHWELHSLWTAPVGSTVLLKPVCHTSGLPCMSDTVWESCSESLRIEIYFPTGKLLKGNTRAKRGVLAKPI